MSNKQKFKGKTLFRATVVKNILKVFNDNTVQIDSDWYLEANKLANTMAIDFELATIQTAGIIAALSPLKSWEHNKQIARQFLNKGVAKHTKAMMAKAEQIKLANTEEEILKILNGNKISSFFVNIAFPERECSVTIDRHAISVALGRTLLEHEGRGITKVQYEFFVSCYKDASKLANVRPNMMQSVTWEKWRILKNRKKFEDVPF